MPTYKLIYFNGRGRAEGIRLMFAAAKIDYEDKRIEREQWPELKPKVPFNALPCLEVDGKQIGQSLTITRFIAREAGMAGKTSIEQAKVDSIADAATELREKAIGFFFEKDEAKKAQLFEEYKEKTLQPTLDKLEAILKENNGGDGFFVGDSITFADVQFFHVIEGLVAMGNKIQQPKLAALFERIKSNPGIAAWLAKRPQTQF